MEQNNCDESRILFEIHAELSEKCHRLCKTLSQQNHVVFQSTAPLQLKSFKVASKITTAASTPGLSNQKKQSCKIARFTDTPCIIEHCEANTCYLFDRFNCKFHQWYWWTWVDKKKWVLTVKQNSFILHDWNATCFGVTSIHHQENNIQNKLRILCKLQNAI